MIRTTLRTAVLAALAAGPALAQVPVAPMPGMQHNGMAMQPGMGMPGMRPGMAPPMSPPVPKAPSMSANDAEMMRQMEVMNRAMMGAPMTRAFKIVGGK